MWAKYFELERIQGQRGNSRFYTQETGKQYYELEGREIFEIDGTELHQSRGGTIPRHDRPGRSLGVVDTRNAQVDQLDAAGGSEGSQSIKSTAPNIQHNSDGQTLPPQVVRVSSDEKDFANIDLSTVAGTSMPFTPLPPVIFNDQILSHLPLWLQAGHIGLRHLDFLLGS